MGIPRTIRDLFRGWLERPAAVQKASSTGRFHLMHHGEAIASLSFDGKQWEFHYLPSFGKRSLRAIMGFPKLDAAYTSKELWPFFALRLPSLRQEGIQQLLTKANIDPTDEVELLRYFGRHSIANPFELVDAETLPAAPRSLDVHSHLTGHAG